MIDFAPTTLPSGRCSAGVGDEVNILLEGVESFYGV